MMKPLLTLIAVFLVSLTLIGVAFTIKAVMAPAPFEQEVQQLFISEGPLSLGPEDPNNLDTSTEPGIGGLTISPKEQGLIVAINRYRRSKGLSTVRGGASLTKAARWMVTDMSRNRYLRHTDSRGRGLTSRFNSVRYPPNTYRGENLAKGFTNPDEVVQAWIKSPAHNRVLLTPQFRSVGVAEQNGYWAAEFGSRVVAPL